MTNLNEGSPAESTTKEPDQPVDGSTKVRLILHASCSFELLYRGVPRILTLTPKYALAITSSARAAELNR